MGLFNNLDLFRYFDKIDMTKGIMDYEIWVWELSLGKIKMIEENWTRQNNVDKVFML
jgi:hypothetical protein